MNKGIKSILIHLIWVSILSGEFKLSFGEENVGAKMPLSDNNKRELHKASRSADSSNAKMSSDEFFAQFDVFMYFYWTIVIGICVVVAIWVFSSVRVGNQPKAKEQKPKPNVSNTSNTNKTNQKVAIKEEKDAI